MSLPLTGQLVHPARGNVREQPKSARAAAPSRAAAAGRHTRRRLASSSSSSSGVPWLAALEEHRVPLGVLVEQPDGAVAVPDAKRVGLVLRLLVAGS